MGKTLASEIWGGRKNFFPPRGFFGPFFNFWGGGLCFPWMGEKKKKNQGGFAFQKKKWEKISLSNIQKRRNDFF